MRSWSLNRSASGVSRLNWVSGQPKHERAAVGSHPFVELRVGPGLCGGAGIVYDKGKLCVESIGYLVSLLDVI